MEETEKELLCFPALFFDDDELPRMFVVLFPLDSPFCFAAVPRLLCFLELFPSFLVSNVEAVGMHGAAGVVEVV